MSLHVLIIEICLHVHEVDLFSAWILKEVEQISDRFLHLSLLGLVPH